MLRSALALLPRGYTLPEPDWQRRHKLLIWVLLTHVPLLLVFGIALQRPWYDTVVATGVPALAALVGHLLRSHRRPASVVVTFGFVFCSVALVALTGGTIEAHFHFFIIIGFIALYQDWVPFLFNVGFTVLSHGLGSAFQNTLIFNHSMGQANPWMWSLVHGVAVLAACVGMVIFWRVTEDQQQERDALARELADAEIGRRKFTSDLLVNLARRNQGMLHRQLEIINQLEESERDPDALAELFKLDHITTRVRRNAESLLVLSGEQPPRVWGQPVPLRDIARAAIAETEDLGRVVHEVADDLAVAGHAVTDLTHLLAELTENAVRFSPPDAPVTLRSRPSRIEVGAHVITVEDWGLGMPTEELRVANDLLANPPDIDLAVHQRLGFHVVARLAARHGVQVQLNPTPGSGITAVVALPAALFEQPAVPLPMRRPAEALPALAPVAERVDTGVDAATVTLAALRTDERRIPAPRPADPRSAEPRERPEIPAEFADGEWQGWWDRRQQELGRERAGGESLAVPEPRLPSGPARRPSPRPRADEDVPTLGPTGLKQRVPQASLAPALRREVAAPVAPAPTEQPRIDPGAASALSRYQANRQAAHDEIDRGAV